jgi:hypothetical protein
MNRLLSVPIVAVALFTANAAIAGPTVYTSAAAFTAATTGVTTNGFNSVPNGTSSWILQSGSYSQPGFTITATNNNAFNSNGTGNPSGYYYYDWGTGGVINTPYGGTLTVTFSTAVTAFALDLGVFYGMAFPYPPGTIPGAATTLYGQPVQIGTSQGNFTVNTATTQNLTFFGVTSDTAFTSFTISGLTNQSGASTVFDNLRFGTAATAAVPEPATWAMMIMGFGMVGASLRRRQAKTTVTFA